MGGQRTQSRQSYQSHGILDLEEAWWTCYGPHSSMDIQAPARGEEAASVSFRVKWGPWRSSASSQAWACCLEGPEMASCESSCSGEVLGIRELWDKAHVDSSSTWGWRSWLSACREGMRYSCCIRAGHRTWSEGSFWSWVLCWGSGGRIERLTLH